MSASVSLVCYWLSFSSSPSVRRHLLRPLCKPNARV
jgi:hypothetical protein